MAHYDFFWQSYLQLERELIHLSETILFDDNNINTYSFKIADLITRVNIEIEALAKQLHIDNGGPAPINPPHLMYDTDCLKYLDTIWTLSKKVVMIVYPFSFFTNDDNIRMKPLREAHKMGDDGPKWKRAYQAIKHDRGNNINKATIKNLISSMAALFLLNIYHKKFKEEFDSIMKLEGISTSFGSKFFAVELFIESKFDLSDLKGNTDNVKSSTIICYPSQNSLNKLKEAEAQYNSDFIKRLVNIINSDQEKLRQLSTSSDPSKEIVEYLNHLRTTKLAEDIRANGRDLLRAVASLKYTAELNKNQFIPIIP